jgi:hypothetical protein
MLQYLYQVVSKISEDSFITYDIPRLCHWFKMSWGTLDVTPTKYLTRKCLTHDTFSPSPGTTDYLKPWQLQLSVFLPITHKRKPGWRSRYSDWLRAGRPRGLSSNPGRVKNFLFSTSSRPVLGPTQASYSMGARGSFPGGKAARAWSWPLTSN